MGGRGKGALRPVGERTTVRGRLQAIVSRLAHRSIMSAVLCLGAAVLMGVSLFFPLWALELSAPQYPAGPLTLYVSLSKLEEHYEDVRGEIFEFKLLTQYLGSRFPDRPPEIILFPIASGVVALLSLTAAFFGRGRRVLLKAGILLAVLTIVAGAVVLQWRLYDFGHTRAPQAPLRDIPAFTVPLLGSSSFANWKSYSRFDVGAYAFGLAPILMGMAYLQQRRFGSKPR
jgi:hypothetical protein